MTRLGTLYGVGAGPGAPDLLTLRAVRVLENADVLALPRSSDFGAIGRVANRRGIRWARGRTNAADAHFPMSKDAAVVTPHVQVQ